MKIMVLVAVAAVLLLCMAVCAGELGIRGGDNTGDSGSVSLQLLPCYSACNRD